MIKDEEEHIRMKTWQILLIISLQENELLSHNHHKKFMNLYVCFFIALY